MIEKGKISSLQMACMMYPTVIATGFLTSPSVSSQFAERDLWISPIWASLFGFFSVFIALQLNKLYPQKTLIDHFVSILGIIPGKIVGFIFVLFLLFVSGGTVWEYAVFVRESFLLHTPVLVITGSIILVATIIIRAGIETIGRLAQLITPVVLVLMIGSCILLLPDMDPKRILPVMEDGIIPSLKGGAMQVGWFTQFIFISFLLPFLSDREQAKKWGGISVLAVMLTFIAINLAVYFVYGEITSSLTYPFLVAIKYISIADFFEHLEAVVMAIWIANEVIKITVFFYILSLATSQLMNLSDYRTTIFPLGLLIIVFAIWPFNDYSQISVLFASTLPFFLVTFRTVIPLLLLLIGYLRIKITGLKADDSH